GTSGRSQAALPPAEQNWAAKSLPPTSPAYQAERRAVRPDRSLDMTTREPRLQRAAAGRGDPRPAEPQTLEADEAVQVSDSGVADGRLAQVELAQLGETLERPQAAVGDRCAGEVEDAQARQLPDRTKRSIAEPGPAQAEP